MEILEKSWIVHVKCGRHPATDTGNPGMMLDYLINPGKCIIFDTLLLRAILLE